MALADQYFSSSLAVVDSLYFDSMTYNGESIRGAIDTVSMVEKQTGFYQSDAQLIVKKSEISAVTPGDTIVFNGTTYRAGKIVDEDSQVWVIEINEV